MSVATLAILAGLALLLLPGVPAAAAQTAAGDGEAVFDQFCSACHTLGGGDGVGPDLAGLPDRRERDWVERFILAPDEVIASGDPIAAELLEKYGAPMPNLGITDEQIGPLIAYLGFEATEPEPPTETETAPEPAPPPAPAPPAGDPDHGEQLFEGSERFESGGPPCLSCHSVAGVGALGGGQLGPDLTNVFEKYGGEQALRGSLDAMPFPTMVPIFSRKPLTEDEKSDLIAFLARAPEQQRDAGGAGKLVGFSIAAAAVLVVVGMGVWRRRLPNVRKGLVDRSRGE